MEANHLIERLLATQCETTLVGQNAALQLHRSGQLYWLYSGGDAIQSVVDLAHNGRLPLACQQAMLAVLALIDRPVQSVLHLGLGAGAFERAFAANGGLPKTWRVIENDKAVIELLSRHLPLPSGLSVEHCDALLWLTQDSGRYDLIFSDLFVGQRQADCVISRQFFDALDKCLAADGAIALNLAPSGDEPLNRLLELAKGHFAGCLVGDIADSGNLIMLLSRTAVTDRSLLSMRAAELDKVWSAGLVDLLSRITVF